MTSIPESRYRMWDLIGEDAHYDRLEDVVKSTGRRSTSLRLLRIQTRLQVDLTGACDELALPGPFSCLIVTGSVTLTLLSTVPPLRVQIEEVSSTA